ncbi:MAG: cytochrome c family protein [Rhizomicrobium sp.]|jgi:cytochrome c
MNIRAIAMTAALGSVLATSAQAAGNAANGAGVFDRCGICHSNTKGGPNKIGPNLFGVVGRKAGTYPGFSYSSAMASSGIVWTDAKLDAYIAAPSTVVPGNKMPFAGITNTNQRADLIAYLNTLK